jgi:Arc/MetJ-type ribon-helix-helix transcriptional regulator
MSDELTSHLFIRITDAEKSDIREARETEGFRSDSEWVRQVLRNAVKNVKRKY